MKRTALNRAFFLSKILGCFPLSLDGGEVKVDYRLLIASLFIKLVLSPQPILNILYATFVISRTRVHLATGKVSYTLAAIFSTVSYFSYFYNRKKLASVLRKYAAADAKLKLLGEGKKPKMRLCADEILVAGILILPCIRSYATPSMTWYKAYQLAYMAHVTVSLFLMVQPFVRIVEDLTFKMKGLRVALCRAVGSVSAHERSTKLESVIQLHDLLCSTSEIINDIFSINLLFFIFMAFFMITTYVYYSMTMGFGGYYVAVIQGIIIVYYGVVTCLIAIHCDKMSKETREFSDLLYHLMVNDATKEIANHHKLRLHITMKKQVSFTACGLFPLDYSLVHSMIAAATTYLVILMNFGD